MCQRQYESIVHEQFLVQSMLEGIVQQLERIERVVEGVYRPGALSRHSEGDMNHITEDDNFEALTTKLMAFSEVNRCNENLFTGSCINQVQRWIEHRPRGFSSPRMATALLSTLDACEGNYRPAVRPLHLDENTLQALGARLAYANSKWHETEHEFFQSPERFVTMQQFQVAPAQQTRSDFSAIRDQLMIETRDSDRRSFLQENAENAMDCDNDLNGRERALLQKQLVTLTAKQSSLEWEIQSLQSCYNSIQSHCTDWAFNVRSQAQSWLSDCSGLASNYNSMLKCYNIVLTDLEILNRIDWKDGSEKMRKRWSELLERATTILEQQETLLERCMNLRASYLAYFT